MQDEDLACISVLHGLTRLHLDTDQLGGSMHAHAHNANASVHAAAGQVLEISMHRLSLTQPSGNSNGDSSGDSGMDGSGAAGSCASVVGLAALKTLTRLHSLHLWATFTQVRHKPVGHSSISVLELTSAA